jgi:hypothetical protein
LGYFSVKCFADHNLFFCPFSFAHCIISPLIYGFWLRIGGVMASVLALSAVDREFEPRSGNTKDYKIGICCFSDKHTALRRKSKEWLARKQDSVSN